MQSVSDGTIPAVDLPIGKEVPRTKAAPEKPDKEEAVARHRSRFI